MTSPQSILHALWAQGLTVELGEGGRLLVSPASSLQDDQRAILRANKPEIVRFLEDCQAQAEAIHAELIRAAMRACDTWGDSPERREEMRQDCLKAPVWQRLELLAYFREKYPARASEARERQPATATMGSK